MKKLTSLMLAGIAVFALSGCGEGSGDDSGLGGASLSRTTAESGSTTTYDSSIVVTNDYDSYEDVIKVESTPHDSNTWSELSGTPIAPGSNHRWGSNRCDQNWDLKVTDAVGNSKIITYYRECYTTTYFIFKSY